MSLQTYVKNKYDDVRGGKNGVVIFLHIDLT